MYSELVRIPIEYSGVPIFGFGVLLIAWLAFAVYGVRLTAASHGWGAAVRAQLPTVLIVGAVIAIAIPRLFPDGVPIRGYGVMVLAGSVAGILLAVYRAQQVRLNPEDIMGLAVAMFVGGIAGARLFYVIEYWEERIRQDNWADTLKAVFSFTEGGLVIYGAFIGAMAGFAWYVRRRELPGLAVADLIAPSMLIGLAFGRVGCLLNGCCYGGETTLPWAVSFPRESGPATTSPPYGDQAASGRFYGFRLDAGAADAPLPVIRRVDEGSLAARAGLKAGEVLASINDKQPSNRQGAELLILDAIKSRSPLRLVTSSGELRTIGAIEPPARSRPVHPTQIYSSVAAGLLAWMLWSYYPFRRRDGEVTALMITLYPVARFLLETIRVDEPAVFGTGLSISQNLSIVLLIVAAGFWLWIRRQPLDRLALPMNAAAS